MKTVHSNALIDNADSDHPFHTYALDNVHSLPGAAVRSFDKPVSEASPLALLRHERPVLLGPFSRVLLRDGEQCHWIRLQDIIYLESCANHTLVFWSTKKLFIHDAIGKIETRLPQIFFRISRQHIVNIEFVTSVELWINGGYRLRLKTGAHVEVSRRHAKRFKESFSL